MPRGGKRPNTGGKRPGAGRPRKAVEEFRNANQMLFGELSRDDARALIHALVDRVKEDGDPKAFAQLAPYLFGPAPKELTVKGDSESPVEVRIGGTAYVSEVFRVLEDAGVFEAGDSEDPASATD